MLQQTYFLQTPDGAFQIGSSQSLMTQLKYNFHAR